MIVEYDCAVCGTHVRKDRSPANGAARARFCSVRCATDSRRGQDTERNRLRKRWWAMIDRCENPRSTKWDDYGGRGIAVCSQWHDFESFLADVGYPPDPLLTLDRIDNDGDYAPGNVRWATRAEQRLNQRPRRSRRAS